MKILSIQLDVDHPDIETSDIFEAPSAFDYDALLLDPKRVAQTVLHASQTEMTVARTGKIVTNKAGRTGPGKENLDMVLRQRKDEIGRLLSRGGLVVCFLRALGSIEGIREIDNWTPYDLIPSVIPDLYSPAKLKSSASHSGRVLAQTNPFAHYFEAYEDSADSQAYFTDGVREQKRCVPIAENQGGYLAACEIPAYEGWLVFLPIHEESTLEGRQKLVVRNL